MPVHVYENVGYTCASKCYSSVDVSGERKAVLEVLKFFAIAADFEKDKAYGPLSGITHSQRVLSAYLLGKLALKVGGEGDPLICCFCGNVGHMKIDCPSL